MPKTHVVVPARLASTRLPRKPLADLAGKPMIVWVAERARLIEADDLVIAVDDVEVLEVVKNAGYDCLLTSRDHLSGSDRVMEVVEKKKWDCDDVVINIQGDEPLLPSKIVDDLISLMHSDLDIQMATLSEPISDFSDFENPNCVKVVTDINGMALYFSRAPIPFPRDEAAVLRKKQPTGFNQWGFDYPIKRHVGIYGFRVSALTEFVSFQESDLERLEKLEQLRWLEAGRQIHVMHSTESLPGGVDTPEDLKRVESVLSAM